MSQPYAQVHVHGPTLRSRRIAADLTLERLASDAGLPLERIHALEAVSWAPVDHRVARGLIEALDCDFYDLFVVAERWPNGK